ncbi:methyl-accepting chemotaxis protein [Telmatospirillum sp. J64-1]|uniref:methyl-accepting chemotaxis protein n=1 Tax=Telmatospirillum sp. J64-1 TaxID=2502183 RepID=UPI00115EAC53|nr:methyl-accepting chemotaxis protein [Telmatospirillum sp. J64-1]
MNMDPVFTERDQALAEAIDHLLAGRYLSVPEGSCLLTRKLHELAQVLEGRARETLSFGVDISAINNEAVTSAAAMMRHVREMDGRSQSIAAAAEEMVASVGEISRNADAAAQDAQNAREAAAEGQNAADAAVRTMESIARAVEDAAAKVDGLAEASAQIGGIVNQIEAIAKQTNLLALNATIEAARAGEAGKGFAVVASEVKNLANQTAKATVDIRNRIENLRAEMSAIVDSMQEGAEAVQSGQEVIAATGQGMRDVTEQIHNVSAKIEEISGILGQQAQATAEVSEGIAVIARMSGESVEGIGGLMDGMDKGEAVVTEALAALGKLEIRDFPLHVAKSDHMVWRKRLAQMMAGRVQLSAEELADHHSCQLGKWYEEAKDAGLSSHPAWQALEAPHRELHAKGVQAARLLSQGNLEGALACLHEVDRASAQVMQHLEELLARQGA